MKLSVAIMGHPSREQWFPYLKKSVGEVPVAIDMGKGVWNTCKRAWMAHVLEKRDYHLVLQDDAILCERFMERALAVIESTKAPAISFYYGYRGNLLNESKVGVARGHLLGQLRWGLAVCLRTDIIDEMIEYGDKLNIPQDDTRIKRFLIKKKISVYYPLPSLVDHRAGPSLVGDKGKHRRAYSFVDDV